MSDILVQIEFVEIKKWGLPDEPGNYLLAWDDGHVETYSVDQEEIDRREVSYDQREFKEGVSHYFGTVYATHWAEIEHPNIALAERAKALAATDKLKGVRLS